MTELQDVLCHALAAKERVTEMMRELAYVDETVERACETIYNATLYVPAADRIGATMSSDALDRADRYLAEAEQILRESRPPEPIVCEACGVESDRRLARGWRAFHGREEDDCRSVVVLCPDCTVEVDDVRIRRSSRDDA